MKRNADEATNHRLVWWWNGQCRSRIEGRPDRSGILSSHPSSLIASALRHGASLKELAVEIQVTPSQFPPHI